MIFTPEERRAVLALAALLVLGQGVSFWEQHRRQRPDRELSAWISRLAQARGDSISQAEAGSARDRQSGDRSSGSPSVLLPPRPMPPSAPMASDASTGSIPDQGASRIPVERPEAVPPGVLEAGRIRINQAVERDLEFLPGIGPALAKRILEDRAARGPFLRPEDLLRVPGIGPKKLARIRDQIECSELGRPHDRVAECPP